MRGREPFSEVQGRTFPGNQLSRPSLSVQCMQDRCRADGVRGDPALPSMAAAHLGEAFGRALVRPVPRGLQRRPIGARSGRRRRAADLLAHRDHDGGRNPDLFRRHRASARRSRAARTSAWLGGRNTIVFGGLAFPIIVLSMLLPYGLVVMRDTDVPKAGALPIEVIGEQYWWRVRYRAKASGRSLDRERDRRAVGRRSRVRDGGGRDPQLLDPEFRRQDRHDPRRLNRLNFTAERPGIYRGSVRRILRRPACAHGLRRGRARPRGLRGAGAAAKPPPEPDLPPHARARARAASAPAAAALAIWCAAPRPMGVSGRI